MSDDRSNVFSFGAAQFNRGTSPGMLDPVTALDAAYEHIRSLEHKPDHIIVMVGHTTPDGGNQTAFFQAGKFCYLAQQGLCIEGANWIRESG